MTSETSSLIQPELTEAVIGCFFNTYNELGPGFPEFVCRRALAITLVDAGLSVVEEASLPVFFRGRRIVRFQVDMVVNGALLLEVKATHQIETWQVAQLRNYLKATELKLGLLFNFGPAPAFRRVVFDTARSAHLLKNDRQAVPANTAPPTTPSAPEDPGHA